MNYGHQDDERGLEKYRRDLDFNAYCGWMNSGSISAVRGLQKKQAQHRHLIQRTKPAHAGRTRTDGITQYATRIFPSLDCLAR